MSKKLLKRLIGHASSPIVAGQNDAPVVFGGKPILSHKVVKILPKRKSKARPKARPKKG